MYTCVYIYICYKGTTRAGDNYIYSNPAVQNCLSVTKDYNCTVITGATGNTKEIHVVD